MEKFRVASFFAGIGGFDLGFEEAGFKIVGQCEIHKFCSSVLKHHWPATAFAQDISVASPNEIPDAEIWCGGFPCQDLSVARGSLGRHGLNGSRSGLFFKLAELAKRKRPRVILIENVHGLLNSNNGQDFAELLRTLGSLHYAVSWRLLNSRYFGVPQSRPRVYICAWLKDPAAAGNVLFEERPPSPTENERSAFVETSWVSGTGPIAPKVAFCLAATSGRHTGTDWSRTYIAYTDAVRRLTPLECERLQGFPDNWTAVDSSPLDVERSDSLRYHALGNAVSVPVVKWIAKRILNEFQRREGGHLRTVRQSQFLAETVSMWPGLLGPRQSIGGLLDIRRSQAKIVWPHAGVLWDGAFVANRTPPSPHRPVPSDLIKILESRRPEQRYFLSANAAEGILRRVDGQGRQLFPPLRRALESMTNRKPSTNRLTQPAPQLKFGLTEPICA